MDRIIQYAKDNLALTAVVGACALLILVLIFILIGKAAKNKKAKKAAAKVAETERIAAEKAAAQKAQADRIAAQKAEFERLKAEKAALEKAEAERVAAEKEAAEKAEAERVAAEKEAAEKAEAERVAAEKEAAEKAEAERLAAEKAAQAKKSEAKKATKQAPPAQTEKKAEPKKTEAKQPAAKKTVKAVESADGEAENSARYAGKWTITHTIVEIEGEESEEFYYFELHASNGEKLLSSEEYSSYQGALSGIKTHKANIERNNFKITLSKKGDYIFKLLSGKNTLLCMGENYPTKARCESAVESTKRFASTAVLDEKVMEKTLKIAAEEEPETINYSIGSYNGKWIISARPTLDGTECFYFELFANNGEKLLSSEEYTTYIGAVNGIATHKTNIEKGNFRISITKRGDYIYKLHASNGQLLCLGEHYKTRRLCQNAVESVKRFALNSPVLTESEIAHEQI